MNFVRDLMVSATNCGRIHQDATIGAVILMLEHGHNEPSAGGEVPSPAALLVLNNDNLVVGKISPTEIVRNMDPIYHSQQGAETIAHTAASGLTPALLKSLTQNSPLRCESFEQICRNVLNLKVKDCMVLPQGNECVLESDRLEEAIHKLAIGARQSLLVTSEERIVGILRLSDVFQQLTQEQANSNQNWLETNNLGN